MKVGDDICCEPFPCEEAGASVEVALAFEQDALRSIRRNSYATLRETHDSRREWTWACVWLLEWVRRG